MKHACDLVWSHAGAKADDKPTADLLFVLSADQVWSCLSLG